MPIFKEIWDFSSTNSGTWSEVFYVTAAGLNDATQFSVPFLNARLNLLSNLNFLEKIRVSQIDNPRNSFPVPIRLQGGDAVSAPAVLSTAVVWTLRSSAVKAQRQWWIRGFCSFRAIRDETNGRDILTPLFAQRVGSFINQLKTNGYIILPQAKPGSPGVNPVVVSNVDGTAATGYALVTTKVAHGLVVGNIAQFFRFSKKDLPGFNGRFKVVTQPDATSFTVNYNTPENAKVVTNQGQVKQYLVVPGATIDPAISNFNFIGEHKSKNVGTGSRGARSANRTRLLA